jgi:hypothetical protein
VTLHIETAIRASFPWYNAPLDDAQLQEPGERDRCLSVLVTYDPTGVYVTGGWLDYESWELSAIANLRRRLVTVRENGRLVRRLGPVDPPHFADGTRFVVSTTAPGALVRYVVIVGGRAVDYERGQWLAPSQKNGGGEWRAL